MAKQYIKVMDFEGEAFQHICRIFPKMTAAKLKAGMFVGPEIRKVSQDKIQRVK